MGERTYQEATHREYINAELEKSMLEANDPNSERLSHEEIMARANKRREARATTSDSK